MINLVRAEMRKLLSTQVWFWMLLLSIAITALLVVVGFLTTGSQDLQSSDVKGIFTTGLTSYIAAFVLGVLGVTTEFRYQTITPTLLATPSRWFLIAAKLITYAVVGAVMAATCALTTLVIAVPWLSNRGVRYSFVSDGAAERVFVVASIVALYSLIGLGFGAAVRNQIAAVTIGVVYLLVIENLLPVIPGVRVIYPYLPGGGIQAILNPHERISGNVHALGVAGGYAVLALWAGALSAAGAAFSLNRDIT